MKFGILCYLNMLTTVKMWHFMIRRNGDCALSSALFSTTIPLLYDVTRGSPDDEFQAYYLTDKVLASI